MVLFIRFLSLLLFKHHYYFNLSTHVAPLLKDPHRLRIDKDLFKCYIKYAFQCEADADQISFKYIQINHLHLLII